MMNSRLRAGLSVLSKSQAVGTDEKKLISLITSSRKPISTRWSALLPPVRTCTNGSGRSRASSTWTYGSGSWINLPTMFRSSASMIPYFEGRVGPGWDQLGTRTSDEDYTLLLKKLKKRPIDYFRLFYADTALFGAREATLCGLKFFGVERTLFASDSPFDPERGSAYIRWGIEIIDSLDISPAERHQIYEGNARRLLKLP